MLIRKRSMLTDKIQHDGDLPVTLEADAFDWTQDCTLCESSRRSPT